MCVVSLKLSAPSIATSAKLPICVIWRCGRAWPGLANEALLRALVVMARFPLLTEDSMSLFDVRGLVR